MQCLDQNGLYSACTALVRIEVQRGHAMRVAASIALSSEDLSRDAGLADVCCCAPLRYDMRRRTVS